MRTVVLIVGLLLQEAIALNAGCEIVESSTTVAKFFAFAILIAFVMDVIELAKDK